MTSDYVDLRPFRTRFVFVQPDADGDWIEGELLAYESRASVWHGWVRYSPGRGQGNYLGWFPENRIRGLAGPAGE